MFSTQRKKNKSDIKLNFQANLILQKDIFDFKIKSRSSIIFVNCEKEVYNSDDIYKKIYKKYNL